MSFKPDNLENDLTVKELLELILLELRKANKYNELGHDEQITEDDLDED